MANAMLKLEPSEMSSQEKHLATAQGLAQPVAESPHVTLAKSYLKLESAMAKTVRSGSQQMLGSTPPGPDADCLELQKKFNETCDQFRKQMERKRDIATVRWGLKVFDKSVGNPHNDIENAAHLLCEDRTRIQKGFHNWSLLRSSST